jgi:hypothetical protein
MKTLLVLVLCSILILSTKITPNNSENLAARLISLPSFWCWYPCYCWASFISNYYTEPPLCWCWSACGCWWGNYYMSAANAAGIGASAARSASAALLPTSTRPQPPLPSTPPSGEPSF